MPFRGRLGVASDFAPIHDLFLADGDVHLIILRSDALVHLEKTTDIWYRATVETNSTYRPAAGASRRFFWLPDEALSPMGCVQRLQFSYGSEHCGPLAGTWDAFAGLARCLGSPPGGDFDAEMFSYFRAVEGSDRWGTFADLFHGAALDFGTVIGSQRAEILLPQRSRRGSVVLPVPDNQWQLDVTYWWSTALASLQAAFVQRAAGPDVPELSQYMVRPKGPFSRQMCDSQKILSSDYSSFSVLGLCLTYAVGAAIIVASYAIEPILALLGRRRRRYPFLEWAANETLQLQRAAYQGIGSGSWAGFTDDIPRARRGEPLANLPRHYVEARKRGPAAAAAP
ncbi:hypothetical protein CDD83_1541 [Cordyceps sp. RAO-2017]|nr:hypothetical protein CDD83_1541 [Cordyceps sp. RAO-2017]